METFSALLAFCEGNTPVKANDANCDVTVNANVVSEP